VYPITIPLFGPFAIHSFGLSIVVGLALFCWCIFTNKEAKALISPTQLSDAIFVGIVAAVVGGRVLAVLGDPALQTGSIADWLSIWDGGLSSLGSVLGVLVGWSAYLYYMRIPIIAFFDIIATYAPIIHIFVRIGCFLAGCCFGCPTQLPWGIVYRHEASLAPLHIMLHPTQLYSVIALCTILAFLLYVRSKKPCPGILLGLYLVTTNTERFVVDFFRGDREFVVGDYLSMLSMHQWIALTLILGGMIVLFWSCWERQHRTVVRHS
jgi:phosphatidylglycerol:prolipoprotein diacylglycerol transferase